MQNKLLDQIQKSRLVLHLLFWCASFYILLNIFGGAGEWQKIDVIYTLIFLITLVLAVYVNRYVLFSRCSQRKMYILFLFLTLLNILFWTFVNQLIFDRLIDYLLPGYYFISYYEFFDLVKFFFVFVSVTTLLHLALEWLTFQESRHLIMSLEKEKIDAEYKALSNQVNPHFLFNSLTVIYSLSLKNAKDTGEAVIRLSDILRYVIYEGAAENVQLASEVMLIENYIALQRFRIHPSTRIKFKRQIENDTIRIIPMVLLPLVENAFKHGVEGNLEDAFIDICLSSTDNVINFTIQNSSPEAASIDKGTGGIGLKNIAHRLSLVYGNRYDLSVRSHEKVFSVDLKIQTGR